MFAEIYRQTRIRWQLNAGKRPRLHPCVSRRITETLQNTGITGGNDRENIYGREHRAAVALPTMFRIFYELREIALQRGA